jgi:dnd system-associated protein 4
VIDDRRLRPPAALESTLETLTDERNFETRQSALTFAAALGFYLKKNEPIQKGGEGIRWQVFERSQDAAFIYSLALAERDTIDVLRAENEEDLATIFEEYAAAGLRYLQDKIIGRPGDALDHLLLILADARSSATSPVPGLDGLSSADLGLLGGLGN